MTDRRKHIVFIMMITMLAVWLSSCGPETMVNETESIPQEVWLADDSLVFPFKVDDTLHPYDLYIQLRHTVDYPYRNLFLFVNTYFPGREKQRDTIEFILAEPNGAWIGKGFSHLKYNKILVRKGLVFPDTGSYRFVFQQAMREDSLTGMHDLGILLSKSDSERMIKE